MDACNNILYFIYILLATTIISIILIGMLKNNRNNSRYRSSLFIFYGIILYHVFYGEKYNGIITSLLILFIFVYVLYAFGREEINLMAIYRSIKSTSITLLIILICCLTAKLIVYKFNDNSWWINENNISNEIERWGDFATFFGGIFALISMYLAYRAFTSQVNASKRTSFDATFTQMFAQHNVLRERVVRHNIGVGMDIFQYCVKYFEKKYISFETTATSSDKSTPSAVDEDISTLWDDFNKKNNIKDVSVDFKNYFKYIYHEINIIVCQQDEVLNDNARQNYVQLIQAQMNYDELFCYFINQVEYLIHWRKLRSGRIPDNVVRHAENLRCYKFFEELCRSRSGHVPLIRNVMEKHRFEVLMLINDDWFY